jgi:MFS family permease
MAQPAASPGSRAAPGSSAGPADRRWLILVVVALAQLMVVLDATIVNIALPSAQHSLGFANSDRQWVVTAYALAFGSLLLVGGRLGDMFSRKWVFITAERRVSHPLLPLRVILDRTRGSSYVAIGVTGVAIFGVFLFLTYYMQQVKGYSPVTTGLLFLPMVGGILVASTISSVVLLPRVGSRVLITAGLLLSGGGTAYLGQLTVTSGYPAHILPALLAMGLGFGMIFAPATNTATAGVPTNDSGVASALVNTMQQVGGSIGVSILSTVVASATTSYLLAHHTGTRAAATAATHGYTLAFTISAALLGLGALLAVLMLPSHRGSRDLDNEDTILVSAPPATAAADGAPAPQRRK